MSTTRPLLILILYIHQYLHTYIFEDAREYHQHIRCVPYVCCRSMSLILMISWQTVRGTTWKLTFVFQWYCHFCKVISHHFLFRQCSIESVFVFFVFCFFSRFQKILRNSVQIQLVWFHLNLKLVFHLCYTRKILGQIAMFPSSNATWLPTQGQVAQPAVVVGSDFRKTLVPTILV